MRDKPVTQFVGFQARPELVEAIKRAARSASIRERRRVPMIELVRKTLEEKFADAEIDTNSIHEKHE